MGITKLFHHSFTEVYLRILWEMNRNTVLHRFHRMPHYTCLTHTIMETVCCHENKQTNKQKIIFLQHDDNGVVEVWLCAFLSLALNASGHLHTSATAGLDDSTGTLEAMQKTKVSSHDRHCVQVPWSSQPAAYHYAG